MDGWDASVLAIGAIAKTEGATHLAQMMRVANSESVSHLIH
jgi:hypothetical protein